MMRQGGQTPTLAGLNRSLIATESTIDPAHWRPSGTLVSSSVTRVAICTTTSIHEDRGCHESTTSTEWHRLARKDI